MKIIESHSSKDTFEAGKLLGQQAKAGEVYCLLGDLGAGKTVFTQGFAQGLGIAEPINSPTFTIVQVYDDGRLPLYHFDVYRLSDVDEMNEIGYEEYFYGSGVSLVEWGNLIEELLPENVITVRIQKDLAKGFDYRRIAIAGNINIPEAADTAADSTESGKEV